MNKAYLLTGGNTGDRIYYLETAKQLISQHCGEILKSSPIYETAAWGMTDQQDFLNQVLFIETKFEAPLLMERILELEHLMGRVRHEKYGPRKIDIDILFFNDEVIQTSSLIVPHPALQNRRFVLEPLNDIAPELMHPVLKKTVHQLLIECPDKLPVKKL
jgi:2-amino-4-hydroxy-6-hydroxymethyldihydropteridine diphosphokinase